MRATDRAVQAIMDKFFVSVRELSPADYREVMEEVVQRIKEHIECLDDEERDES